MDVVSYSSKLEVTKFREDVMISLEGMDWNISGARRMMAASASRTTLACGLSAMNRSLNR